MIRRQLLIGWIFLFSAIGVYPHSMQPTAVLRFSEVHLAPDALSLIYIVEPGSIPFQDMAKDIDQNEDRNFSEEDLNAFLDQIKDRYSKGQNVSLADETLDLNFHRGEVYEAVGHHSADTVRIELGYLADIPASVPRGATVSLSYEDTRLKGVPGWKQIKFFPEDGVRYSGHVPYGDYAMFDLSLEQELQFTPSTHQLNLQVHLPENPSRDSRELLAAKLDNSPLFNSGLVRIKEKSTTVYWILGGMVVIFALGLAAKQFGWVR